ncbi:MAG TPA: chloride channel protein [Acidimicrobiales bacterium]
MRSVAGRFRIHRERLAGGRARSTAELRAIGHRARQVGVLAAATGALTGLAVAGFERFVSDQLFDRVLDGPLWLQAIGPALGLTVAALALRWLGGESPSTADEYIKDFHDPEHRLRLTPVPGRLVASAATLGGGAAMGFEGPSIYMGAAIGTWLQIRFSRFFSRSDTKVLLVCGAAAGVAAIFKAPATGVVFALEVPYRQDLARRMLLPAMFSAAASYVVFAAINGTTPLFPIAGAPPFDLRDLGGAALLGLACGLGARLFTSGLLIAKRAVGRYPASVRLPVAGVAIVAVFVLGRVVSGESLTIGSGYAAINWSLEPGHAIAVILAVFLLRALATTLALGAGGVGGLFIPLVVQGALLGSALGAAVGASDLALFPVLGIAAFLGAGYRVPLAAVVFVAESTGRPGFIVPGLIAAASSQLLIGNASASAYQQDARTGVLERRLALPVSSALRTDAATVPSDATIDELFNHHIRELRLRVVPVVDGSTFRGVVTLDDVARLPDSEWPHTPASAVMQTDWPTGQLTWTLAQAVAAMEGYDVDRIPILDRETFVGMITTGEILKLDAILETTEEGHTPPTRSKRSP